MSRSSTISFLQVVNMSVGSVLVSQGFCLIKSESHTVSYRSDDAKIDVYHDTYSFELGLDAKWIMYPDSSFSLSELLRLQNHPEAATYRNFIAVERNAIALGLQRLSRLLLELFAGGMRFDQSTLDALQRQQTQLSKKMEDESHNRRARAAASAAWAKKDFPRFIEALNQVQEKDLTALELRRLSYISKTTK